MTEDLRARVADAIAYHPSNRGASLEQRERVAGVLADAVMAVVEAEQHVVAHNAAAADSHAEEALRIAERAEAERDAAYRERAQLLALLAAHYPAVLAPAPDVEEPGWQILYLDLAGRQCSWHIAPADAAVVATVPQVDADDPRAAWDGHSTEEKYRRIAERIGEMWRQRAVDALGNDEAICGDPRPEPPENDCWCTLPPGHGGEHQCGPCTERHGAPGWADEEAGRG